MISITCKAPINIAVIKYWGKRDEDLVLPINGSISATLDHSQLRAKTSVAVSNEFKTDQMWLNGIEQSLDTPRFQTVLKDIRRRARKRKQDDTETNISNWHIHICSENNFPTAAGLASSAAGFACLAYGLTKLFKLEDDLPIIARQGSGSACRSVYGGLVEWRMGSQDSGSDCVSVQLQPHSHWPQLRVLILVVSAKEKEVSSSDGMKRCVQTSELLKHRASHCVPARILKMREAIAEKDFASFAELTMKDSNEMHACCLDTLPPISYLNDVSHQIQALVHHINDQHESPVVAYTFDAGPNACLFMLDDNVPEVLGYVTHCYQADPGREAFITGIDIAPQPLTEEQEQNLPIPSSPGSVQYAILTKVGPGPQVLDDNESLLKDCGMPKKLNQKL